MRGNAHAGWAGRPGRRTGRKAATAPRAHPTSSRFARAVGSCRWRPSWRPAWRRPRDLKPGEPSATARTAALWTAFLRSLRGRGLAGVRLVISDAQGGSVKGEPSRPSAWAPAWQRCGSTARGTPRTSSPPCPEHGRLGHPLDLEQPDERSARDQSGRVIDGIRPRFPAVAELLGRRRGGPPRPLHGPRQPPPTDPQHQPARAAQQEIPVLDWSMPEEPRRWLVRWVTVPRPDSKEISGATSFGWLSAA